MTESVAELYTLEAFMIFNLLSVTYIIYQSVVIIKRHRNIKINSSYSILSVWIFFFIIIACVFRLPYSITVLSLHWGYYDKLILGIDYIDRVPKILCQWISITQYYEWMAMLLIIHF